MEDEQHITPLSSLTCESGLSGGSLISWYNDFIILISC